MSSFPLLASYHSEVVEGIWLGTQRGWCSSCWFDLSLSMTDMAWKMVQSKDSILDGEAENHFFGERLSQTLASHLLAVLPCHIKEVSCGVQCRRDW